MKKQPSPEQISRVMAELGRRGAKAGHAKKDQQEKSAAGRALALKRWGSRTCEPKK